MTGLNYLEREQSDDYIYTLWKHSPARVCKKSCFCPHPEDCMDLDKIVWDKEKQLFRYRRKNECQAD